MEFLAYHLLIILLCLNTIAEGIPYHRKGCLNHIDKPLIHTGEESICKYGMMADECGHEHCMKGPGEFCGGRNNIYGICASGLECSDCNRCRGCSVKTLKCFEDECLKILYRLYNKLG